MIYTIAVSIFFLSISALFYFLINNAVTNYQQYKDNLNKRLEALWLDTFIQHSVRTLLFGATILSILLSITGWIVFVRMGWPALPGAALGFIVSAKITSRWIEHQRQDHRNRFIKQLPDALRTLAGARKSGLELSQSLQQLVEWQPAPLSQEFRRVRTQIELGVAQSEAFDDLYKRIPEQEVELMNIMFQINKNSGGKLGDSLEAQAYTLSEIQNIKGKVMTLTASARTQAKVLMVLPIFVGLGIMQIQPEYAEFYFGDPLGRLILGIFAILMFLAHLTIQRIINIDV